MTGYAYTYMTVQSHSAFKLIPNSILVHYKFDSQSCMLLLLLLRDNPVCGFLGSYIICSHAQVCLTTKPIMFVYNESIMYKMYKSINLNLRCMYIQNGIWIHTSTTKKMSWTQH